jgi:uncharacterized protein (TIGR01370 family)
VLTRLAGCFRIQSTRQYFFLFSLFIGCVLNAQTGDNSNYNLAFYYGDKPPLIKLKFYKNIVLEPSSGVDPKSLETQSRKVFAYTSLGEAERLNQYEKPIKKSWVIAKNKEWHSLVLDQANPEWQDFFLNEVISPLWDKGYRGFFLDTLDSYRLASEEPQAMKRQQEGIIATLRAIKTKYPDAQLILNRGFEVISEVQPLVHGLVAESLFGGWNNEKKKYYEVSEHDRKELLKELVRVKNMGIPVTVIDYLAPADASKAQAMAKKIADLGFNPWVTDGALTQLYLFDVELLARKILLLYRGKRNDVDALMDSYASSSISMPLNHMGYVTEIRNVEEPLPQNISAKEYAGIVATVDGLLLGREDEMYHWYKAQIQKKIPLVVLNGFGFPLDNDKLKFFGLSTPSFTTQPHTLKVLYQAPMLGYEIQPIITKDNFVVVKAHKGKSLLKISDEVGNVSDLAAITPWGGYFLTSSFLVPTAGNFFEWSVDPFVFFKEALKIPDRPIPDTTSENGRRLMLVHIDGDGFVNRGEWYKGGFTGDILSKEFLEKYAIPTTVSIVQGEIAPNGLYPKLSPELEKIARRIFALPYVEIGSHTFSHPFVWPDAMKFRDKKKNPYTLPIPNYHLNLYTEVAGSIDYINKNLTTPDKPAKAILWSGEGDVPEEALKYTYQLGLANINPGRLINNYHTSLTRISSLGLFQGDYFQLFAPIGNDYETIRSESVFYSIINIIDAFKLTDKPRRLKAIDIYIHFYTVTQPGGIKALHAIYDWALSQPIMNLFVSDFFNKATDFNELAISKKGDGWLVVTNDALRELRLPHSMPYPDLQASTNVIGYSFYNDDCYVHLGPGGEAFVRVSKTAATLPFLMDSNARVSHFARKDKGIDLGLEGYMPIKVTFANMNGCSLFNREEKQVPHEEKGNQKYYEFKNKAEHELSIRCE